MSHIRKIVLASVLKPSDDPRMYKKIGQTLAEHGFEVHTIGSMSTSRKVDRDVTEHGVFLFGRISLGRFFAFFPFFRTLHRLKPDLLIVCTFELLPAACLYKFLYRKKLIYDIQENYFRNILHTKIFPWFLKFPLALLVRMKEFVSIPFMNGFIFAEHCYEREMSFIPKSKSIILENTFKGERPITVSKTWRRMLHFLYSGTVSEHYGIREAFLFIEKLHAIDPEVSLTVIGACSIPTLFEELRKTANTCTFIDFRVQQGPVSHEAILEAVRQADAGLLPYHQSIATAPRVPTKMFEYMAHTLPMVVQENSFWEELCTPHKAALFIDFKNFDEKNLLAELKTTVFYPNGAPEQAFWSKEKTLLTDLISRV